MTSCTPSSSAYTDPRGVETSLQRPTAPDSQRLFCAPRLDSVYGLEGTGIPEYRPPPVAVSNLQAAHLLGSDSNFENLQERHHDR